MTVSQNVDANLQKSQTERLINRGFFDREHPAESIGFLVRGFSISLNEAVGLEEREKLKATRNDLYNEIYKKLTKLENIDNYLARNTKFKTIKYIDTKYGERDKERLYLVIQLKTIRNTRITTLCRFFVHGNNLYLAVDSYALGTLKVSQLIWQSIIALILIPSLPMLFAFFVIPGILALVYLYKVWIDVIRSLVQKEPLLEALRQKFNNNVSNNSFDEDDTLMYLKSIFPLIINSVSVALEKNGLLKEGIAEKLDKFLETGQQVINIDTGGGNVLGSIFGGKSNQINN